MEEKVETTCFSGKGNNFTDGRYVTFYVQNGFLNEIFAVAVVKIFSCQFTTAN